MLLSVTDLYLFTFPPYRQKNERPHLEKITKKSTLEDELVHFFTRLSSSLSYKYQLIAHNYLWNNYAKEKQVIFMLG